MVTLSYLIKVSSAVAVVYKLLCFGIGPFCEGFRLLPNDQPLIRDAHAVRLGVFQR